MFFQDRNKQSIFKVLSHLSKKETTAKVLWFLLLKPIHLTMYGCNMFTIKFNVENKVNENWEKKLFFPLFIPSLICHLR